MPLLFLWCLVFEMNSIGVVSKYAAYSVCFVVSSTYTILFICVHLWATKLNCISPINHHINLYYHFCLQTVTHYVILYLHSVHIYIMTNTIVCYHFDNCSAAIKLRTRTQLNTKLHLLLLSTYPPIYHLLLNSFKDGQKEKPRSIHPVSYQSASLYPPVDTQPLLPNNYTTAVLLLLMTHPIYNM